MSYLPSRTDALLDGSFYKGIIDLQDKIKIQRLTTHQAEKSSVVHYINSQPRHDQVRLSAMLTGYGTSAHLTVAPDPDRPDTRMSTTEARYAFRLRYGMPPVDGMCKCKLCGSLLTSRGALNHFSVCTSLRRRSITRRHDSLVRLFAKWLRLAGVPMQMEYAPPGQDRGVRMRPDGCAFFVPGDVMFDVSITDPSAPGLMERLADDDVGQHVRSCLAQLQQRAADKTSKYKQLAENEGFKFSALVLDTFGRLHPDLIRFLRSIQAAFEAQPHLELPEVDEAKGVFRCMVEEISTTLQRGNARAMHESAMHAERRRRAVG